LSQSKTWDEYIKSNYSSLLNGGHWFSRENGTHVFVKEDPLKKLEKVMKSLKKEEDSSPIPEKEWVKELQWALDTWRDTVFRQKVDGLLKDKDTQHLSSP
jgi:hypothetical protein